HTEGSVCYKIDNYLFTGDTLFRMSVGRTDLKGGDNRKLKSSLRILSQLNPELIVCPGHDSLTTLKEELESNPYLK
ncbi:MAG: MBL fold metallo-hydrolase, partial [Bacilli bacterium]|nr:MBL fold metallo-hydrolase [Bacilli bacterium]